MAGFRRRGSFLSLWFQFFVIIILAFICVLVTNCSNDSQVTLIRSIHPPPPQAPITTTAVASTADPIISNLFTKTEILTEVTIVLKNEPSTTNAKVAAKIINGKILKPGEMFSFNQIVGERTATKGFVYAPMPVLEDGVKTIHQSMGSGICRLSVALATASDRLGFPNYGRVKHTFTPYYFATNKKEKLSDSTIYWPNTDNKFKNTKDFDILINTSIDKNYVLKCVFSKIIRE